MNSDELKVEMRKRAVFEASVIVVAFLVALKLDHRIDWTWGWIMFPLVVSVLLDSLANSFKLIWAFFKWVSKKLWD